MIEIVSNALMTASESYYIHFNVTIKYLINQSFLGRKLYKFDLNI